jgi:isopenicillin N synthase-like dioxygenase
MKARKLVSMSEAVISNSVTLPKIDSIASLSNSQIRDFLRYGFCYFKLPNNRTLKTAMSELKNHAVDFYRQDRTEKEKNQLDQKAFEHGKATLALDLAEQLLFYPEDPIPPFKVMQAQIKTIVNSFYHDIGYPLLKSVFMLTAGPDSYKEAIQDPIISLGINYYPDKDTSNVDSYSGSYEHQDWGLINMLHVDKPGLIVQIEGKWHPIYPLDGYIVINIGAVTELTLNAPYDAHTHKVVIPESERLSYGVFVAPNMETPIKNVVTGQEVSKSYKDFTQSLFATNQRKKTVSDLHDNRSRLESKTSSTSTLRSPLRKYLIPVIENSKLNNGEFSNSVVKSKI